ncbi:MAG: bifunctional 23S rRNA (guanine(2069)-N(7))-methyltransferase RlmK/23S rRNA (guanine(2445)-N(2))-methyltransferase RlmL [Gammaproteobacteria bacterium]|nr:bifunctional 23S rRNA (guanine(2069)-N(7))-methyltransferase RlmK/23S rRNA (guanine(2445)-N(2))-methyltransferase RlmL [Gammaproteobacteria bacterium]
MVSQYQYFATTPKYTESLLCEELQLIGADKIKATIGGVAFCGDLSVAYKACLWSRIASRILLPLKKKEIYDAEQLYNLVYTINWGDYFLATNSIAVDFHTSNSNISHSQFGAQKTKDAIVDQFRQHTGKRPSVDKVSAEIRINVHLNKNIATVSLDLCGHSLQQRGYRLQNVAAPLKENLAAAILMRARWLDIARQGGPLVDPMCGSGTFLIEAACMTANIAPGLFREDFSLRYLKTYDALLWNQLRSNANNNRTHNALDIPPIIGFDSDHEAISISQQNCHSAGLSQYITLEQRPIEKMRKINALKPGLVVSNPPYGERLGIVDKLIPLYQNLGDKLKDHFPAWRAAILTSEQTLGQATGIRAKRINTFYNGNIACQLLHFDIDASHFMRQKNALKPQQNTIKTLNTSVQMFANRLIKNLKHLGKWANKQNIGCYRLYDADLPEYAFAIDVYQSDKLYIHMQEYTAPKTIDPSKAKQRSQDALCAVPLALRVEVDQIYYKQRRRQTGTQQYEKLNNEKNFITVQESGRQFLVNLQDYLDTGLFLDHRITRSLIQKLANQQRFLNLFAYTGTASVYAALGGATQTTSVDISNTYLDWSKKNFILNEINLKQHRFIQADCLEWIKNDTNQYDLIFLDPPTFSNSKKMNRHFDIQRDHSGLIKACLARLSTDGILLFSSNYRKFKFDASEFTLQRIEDISKQTIPKDFERNHNIHRCWKIQKTG